MRKINLTVVLLILSSVFIQAQNPERFKPVEGDWGLSLNISGLINNIVVENNKDNLGQFKLFGRHYLKDDMALRLGFGTAYLKNNSFNEDSVTIASGNRALQTLDSTSSRFDFKVSVGVEKHLGTTKRLDPYVGAELNIIRIGATKNNTELNQTDITGTHVETTTLNTDGGAGFGLGVIAGFNYFIAKNLSLGVEFGYAYNYTKIGGDFNSSSRIVPVSGTDINSSTTGKASTSEVTIGATATSGIMLSFFF